MQSNGIKGSHLEFLDGLRGIAAIYVVIGHARWLLWEGFSFGYAAHPGMYTNSNKLMVYFFSLFKFGHEAVMFFFILSGFVIHLRNSYILKTEPENFRFQYSTFFKKRLNRLYPPLIIAIIVTVIFDFAGSMIYSPLYNKATIYPHIHANIGSDHSYFTLFGNLLFLMEGYVNVWGSNGPLWSLFYEWWFYMLYPIIFIVYQRSILAATLLVLLMFGFSHLLIGYNFLLIGKILSYFIIWWLGVLLADVFTERIKVQIKYFSILILMVAVLPFLKIESYIMYDLMISLGFIGLLSWLLHLSKMGNSLRRISFLKPLGDFSYSLYICHFPILVFLSAILMRVNNQYLPYHLGYVFCGVFLSLAISYLLYLVGERPFITGWVYKKLLVTKTKETSGF